MRLYIVTWTYDPPLTAGDPIIARHDRHLHRHYEQQHVIVSGHRVPNTGGVLLTRAASRAALEDLLATDPLVQTGGATFEIIEFAPTRCDPTFTPLLG